MIRLIRLIRPTRLFAAWHLILALAAIAALSCSGSAQAERVKDLASIQGVRNNPLSGYGIVIGLDGTGDQTAQTPFTVQSIASMLMQMGVNLPPGQIGRAHV